MNKEHLQKRRYQSIKESVSLPLIANRASCLIKKTRRPPAETWGSTTIEHVLDKKSVQPSRNSSLSSSRIKKAAKSVGLYDSEKPRLSKEALARGLKKLMMGQLEGKSSRFNLGKENSILETTIAPDEDLESNSQNKPLIFDSSFHKKHFKSRVNEEISRLELKLPRNITAKGFLLPAKSTSDKKLMSSRGLKKKKYTRMRMSEHQDDDEPHLSKVPRFLMEVLPPQRYKPSASIQE